MNPEAPQPKPRVNVAGIVDRESLQRGKSSAPDDELEDVRQAPLSFRIIRRLLGYTRPYKTKMRWLLVTVFTRGVQLPILAWAIGAIIKGPVTTGDAHVLVWAVTGFVIWALLTEFNFHFRIRLAQEIGESVIHDLRGALFHHWLGLPMSYFQKMAVGRMISRLTGDAEGVRAGVQNVLFVTLVQSAQMLGAALLMAWEDWRLFVCAMGIAPVVWFLNRLFRGRLSAAYRAQSDSFSRISATMAESVGGVRVTQSFSRQDVNEAMFHDLVADHARYNFEAAKAGGQFLPLLELSSQAFLAALLMLGGWLALDAANPMPVGSLIQFFFLAGLFFQPIVLLGNLLNEAMTAMAGAEKLFRVLDTLPDWTDPPDAVRPDKLRGDVEFRDVGFHYTAGRPALEHISFSVPAGACVALVGATGSGKSTLASLLAKFHLPSAGTILIDGMDLRQIHGESLHRHLGVVPQHNYLFSGTVLENIAVVKRDATREDVLATLRKLNCRDVVEAIPGGLDADVGEHGSSLSLGQRQMICFARALLADPALLILDEATSAVDPITEKRTQTALQELLRDRTSFIVAHRLSTIRNADLVLVLDHGKIVEQGSPTDLLRRGGQFAALWAKMA